MSKPAVVDPRAGSVQTAEGAGVFFLSTHLQGCQIIVTSDGLAVILSADNVRSQAGTVREEVPRWSYKDAVTLRSHQCAKISESTK